LCISTRQKRGFLCCGNAPVNARIDTGPRFGDCPDFALRFCDTQSKGFSGTERPFSAPERLRISRSILRNRPRPMSSEYFPRWGGLKYLTDWIRFNLGSGPPVNAGEEEEKRRRNPNGRLAYARDAPVVTSCDGGSDERVSCNVRRNRETLDVVLVCPAGRVFSRRPASIGPRGDYSNRRCLSRLPVHLDKFHGWLHWKHRLRHVDGQRRQPSYFTPRCHRRQFDRDGRG
jgi:hypothetical protein